MKKCLFFLLLIVSLSALIAVESDPSATVGYFKKSIASGGWEAFSLPFSYPVLSPDSVLGAQFGDLDMIIDMNSPFGDNAMYLVGVGWIGTIVEMAYGNSYWISRDYANPTTDYFLMGKVDPHELNIHVSGLDEGGWSAFGLNEARPIDVNTLAITGVQDLDMIIDISSPFGDNAMYLDGIGWIGTLTNINPTYGYWYNSGAAVSYNWTYTPAARSSNQPSTSRTKK